jgi:hypothetical protein
MPGTFERLNAALCAGAEALGVAAAVFMIALCADVPAQLSCGRCGRPTMMPRSGR